MNKKKKITIKILKKAILLHDLLHHILAALVEAILVAALVAVLVDEGGYSPEEAEAAVVLGAYLDDVVVGLPAEAVARVPSLAAQAFAPVGCQVEQQKTKV